jgi:Ca-activated chloride channel family protein
MLFQNPSALLLMLLVPLAWFIAVRGERVRQARLQRLGDAGLINLLLTGKTSGQWQKMALWTASLCCLIAALARPAWGLENSPARQEGLSIALLLDVSSSMNAQDVLPSRLTRAKLDAQQLMREFTGNEFALVLFAGSAFLQFPLTTDLASAEVFLQDANSDSISRQGTNLDAALRVAAEMFRIVKGRGRVVIIMSDGETFDGDALAPATTLTDEGVTIYAIGYGTVSGAEIPLQDGNVKTDVDGDIVTTRLDEGGLQQIAERGHGSYWRADEEGITLLSERLRTHETGAISATANSRLVERFGLFLALALGFLSAEMLLREVRRAG